MNKRKRTVLVATDNEADLEQIYWLFAQESNPVRPREIRATGLLHQIDRDESRCPAGGTTTIAGILERDPRTIRRWLSDECIRESVFPTAFRTDGGHWRVPIRDLPDPRKIDSWIARGRFPAGIKKLRRPKKCGGRKAARIAQNLTRVDSHLTRQSLLLASRDLPKEDVKHAFKGQHQNIIDSLKKGESVFDEEWLLYRLEQALSRLAAISHPPSRKRLAHEMMMSRATFYRWLKRCPEFKRKVDEVMAAIGPV